MSVVAEYHYHDAAGNVVGKVERIEPGRNGRRKDFVQYHVDASGGYVLGLNGKALPWYHASELERAANGKGFAFLVEGEGKCDALFEPFRHNAEDSTLALIVVVSLAGGCKAPLTDEHLAGLEGLRTLVILPDCDEPGRASAKARADLIAATYPEMDVRVIDLAPERDDGYDIADWLVEAPSVAERLQELRAIFARTPRHHSLIKALLDSPSVPGDNPDKPGVSKANLIDLREMRFERVRWLEYNMIPFAEMTLVNGDGGIGKTTCILDLIARASAGRTMPSGLILDRPLRCLIIAEEDRHGLLRARLQVAGADFDNIRLMESVGEDRTFATFPTHTLTLRQTIAEGGYAFVLIDAFLNHIDDDLNASKPQDMRRVIRPLAEVAHDTGAAIVGIRHLGKAAGSASTRGLGSIEARNVARSELTIAEHPDQETYPGLVVVALSKANLAEDRHATLAFRLLPEPIVDDDGEETTIARVEWDANPPALTADELTERPEAGERSKIDAAGDWLRDRLAGGKERASEVCKAGKKEGYPPATLYRARKQANVDSEVSGYPAQAYWFIKTPLDSQILSIGEIENPDNADKPAPPETALSLLSENGLRPSMQASDLEAVGAGDEGASEW